MNPFDTYPEGGRTILKRAQQENTRHEDAPELQRLTGQTACAYCGEDLVGTYERWLLTQIDHVIPTGEAKRLGIPKRWRKSFSNIVICCAGCNGFDNRFKAKDIKPRKKWSKEEFFELRSRYFKERQERILARRAIEMEFFESKPWLLKSKE